MTFYDDDDKYNDDYAYDDDDDYDEDEEEDEEDDNKGSSIRSRVNPFSGGTGGLPGSNRVGGGSSGSSSPSSSGSRDDLASRLNRSTSSSGTGTPSSGGGFYNRPSSPGSGSSSSGTGPLGGDRRTFGGGSSPSGGSSGSGSTSGGRTFGGGFGGSGSGSGSSGSGSSSPVRPFGGSSSSGSGSGTRPTGPLSGGSGTRPTGPLSGGSQSTSKPDDKKDEKKDDSKDDKQPATSRFGGFGGLTSRLGGGSDDKKDEKKDDKKPAESASSRFGGLGGLTSKLGGGSSDKPADAKKDDKPGEAKPGVLGGLTSRFGAGGSGDKKDEKKDDKKPGESSSGGLGAKLGGGLSGITSRFGAGGSASGDEKKDDKKPAESSGGGIGAKLGGLTSRFTGGGAAAQAADKPASPASSASGSSPSSGGFGSRPAVGGTGSAPGAKPGGSSSPAPAASGPRFGSASAGTAARPAATAAAGGDKPATTKAAAATGSPVSGFLASITKRLPFGYASGDDKKAPKATSKTRAAKIPQTSTEGMSLDTKLDILGVALVFGALLLFLSALSPQPGAITGALNSAFSQMLGLGASAVPLTMLAAGVWLILRHFGDQAPVIDPVRVAGVALLYATLLVIFQYAESFNPVYKNDFQLYQALSPLTIQQGRGGGQVGWTLYQFLVMNATEIGGMVIAAGAIVVSIMLLTRTSAAELAVIVISIWRSFQVSLQRRAQQRAAAQLAMQQATPLQPQISVSRPAAAELPAGAPVAALPPPPTLPEAEPIALPIEERPITIRTGGRTLSDDQPVTVPLTASPPNGIPRPAAATTEAETPEPAAGGFAARLRSVVPGGLNRGAKPAEEAADKPAQPEETSGGLRGMFARRTTTPDIAAKSPVPAPPAPAHPVSPLPTTGSSASPFARPKEAKPEVTPAAASAASAAAETSLPDDFFKPAQPKGIGPLARPQPTTPLGSGAAGSSELKHADKETQETEAVTPVKEASEQPAAASTATATAAATAATDGVAGRQERLNELRQGIRAQPEAQSAAPTPATPAAEPLRPRPYTPTSTPAPTVNGETKTPETANPVQQPAASVPATPAAPSIGPAVAANPKIVLPGSPDTPPVAPAEPTVVSGQSRPRKVYTLPDYRTLLSSGSEQDFDREGLVKRARTIEETLQSFGAPGRVVEINTGPVITQFGVEPDYLQVRGGKKSRVKVSAIAQLDKDLQLALGAKAIRIEAPVPGKGFVGVEVPNDQPATVSLRDVMEAKEFTRIKSPLAIALGQSVDGAPVSADLTSMPHLLIAGTTGSGKSVCVNAIIASLLLRNSPDQVKFIMVDPKRVELTGYNGIPHLIAPVVVELERIVGVLKWVTREMDERYKKFSNAGARNIEDFNRHLSTGDESMPYIVVIIDELADLMMLAPEETERTITRIAALARATGIHLVIATQRPSVDVVTGLIKANFPARIAFAVAGGVDSRVILDQPGAERLLGKGDMLYMSGDAPAPQRLQGVFVSDMEINNIVRFWRSQQATDAPQRPITALVMDDSSAEPARATASGSRTFGTLQTPAASPQQAFWDKDDDDDDNDDNDTADGEDEMYDEAVEMVRRLGKASVSLLQRRLRIGYTRAARLIDVMEERGIIGPATEGSKPREVLK